MSKQKIYCTMTELIDEVNSSIPDYLKHVYITNHQYFVINNIYTFLKQGEALVVIDFSQNYVSKCSKEAQGIHFGASKKPVSLQTGAFYYKKSFSDEISCVTFCTISESLRHDAAGVWAHLEPVLNTIKNTVPNFFATHFQSDGPSTQYKNKSNFQLFQQYCERLNLNYATWNFTASGHGKSTADAVGGTVKGLCDHAVAQGKDVVSAECLLNVINASKVQGFLVKQSDIERIDLCIDKKIKPSPNTKQIFQLTWTKKHTKTLFLNSLSCSYCVQNCLYDPPCNHFSLNPHKLSVDEQTSHASKTNAKSSRNTKTIATSSKTTKVKSVDQEVDSKSGFDIKPSEVTKKVPIRSKIANVKSVNEKVACNSKDYKRFSKVTKKNSTSSL